MQKKIYVTGMDDDATAAKDEFKTLPKFISDGYGGDGFAQALEVLKNI